ncbi:hypothetical protein COU19_00635 [Candidatus Kaiserbacteria bacterium CG10_big_fil_rev_8_21_14_0_10_56_12]|uniref:PrcB C-terminal domain-containing protein n=1 Tax=Candidatus Kaiserbacteria bacterium CG10_big_fil_rev_8_21_14_0_10_56_12 TaxID=1974611 RepID=A0A2H0UAK5_9BACT|nr:MAG: hypothetical protein COU19_00635 [Candidatus Kaiserbacteria bacterium CG10_big_fil_rev_8_21_14_0_10_56_12]
MRDAFIALGIGIVAVILGALVVGSGFSTPGVATPGTSESGGGAVSFREIVRGARSTVERRTNYIIRSAPELAEVWSMIDTSDTPPVIDFTRYDVIAVFAGTEPTAEYAINVLQVEDGVTRKVTIRLTSPSPSCVVAEGETAPYQLVELPKTTLTLTHKDVPITTNCLK